MVIQRFVVKTRSVSISWDKSAGCLVAGQTATGVIGSLTLIRALVRNCGNQSFRCQRRSTSGIHREASVLKRNTGTDRPIRAMKAGNAAGAKGAGQVAAFRVQLATGGNL